MKKSREQFWILFMIATMLIAAVALGEFLQWSDKHPEVRERLGLE